MAATGQAEVAAAADAPNSRVAVRRKRTARPLRDLDMSETGARLAAARPLLNLPSRFTLLLEGKVQRQCEIVWADVRYVGVKFV